MHTHATVVALASQGNWPIEAEFPAAFRRSRLVCSECVAQRLRLLSVFTFFRIRLRQISPYFCEILNPACSMVARKLASDGPSGDERTTAVPSSKEIVTW